jgi:hypothetical protein
MNNVFHWILVIFQFKLLIKYFHILAARYGLTELIDLMVSAGGDIHHKSKDGFVCT